MIEVAPPREGFTPWTSHPVRLNVVLAPLCVVCLEAVRLDGIL